MSYFFELLQVALGTRSELSGFPTANEWSSVFNEAQKQAVVGLLLDGLERLPAKQRPAQEILLEWIGLAQMVETTYALQCEQAKELKNLFLMLDTHRVYSRDLALPSIISNQQEGREETLTCGWMVTEKQ